MTSTKSHKVSKIKDSHDFGLNSKIAKKIIKEKYNSHTINIEEFKNKIGLSDSKIKEAIDSSINVMNKYDNTKYKIRDSYKDVVLFYDFEGNLYASYLLKEINKYMLAKVEM